MIIVGDNMDIKFKIDEFEGPLDLLLHLIKESKMDIFDIQIEEITKQYLAYIESQEKLNLEIASEYLVMASELLEIKSKMLLPRNEEELEIEEEDPREQLVSRLLEYEAYKEITKTLKAKEDDRRDIYTKMPENVNDYIENRNYLESGLNIEDLTNAFLKFLQRKEAAKPLKTKVTVKEISVSSRRRDIKKILKKEKKVSFFKLFPVVTKEYIVATFLAILEMAKNNELLIKQKDTFEDIVCEVPNGK